MITGLRGLVGFSLMCGFVGTIHAEQITSTCRITAVDAAAHTVTLVRNTATGEKTGVAKVAATAKVTVDGQVASLESLTPPVDATVVFDTVTSSAVEIRVAKSMTKTGPRPAGAVPPLATAPFDAAKAKEHQAAWAKHLGVPVEMTNSIGMKFVLIPLGEFEMGSPESEVGRDVEEYQHKVRITKSFYLGMYEVTQDEYERLMRANPSYFASKGRKSSRFPVEGVGPEKADEFCRKLSESSEEQRSGRVYRLPTEAEWEYACRAGTATPFHFGTQLNGQQANCVGTSPYGTASMGPFLTHTTTVGSYAPNAFGLYDMHGNVWEWCQDRHAGNYYHNSPMDDPQGPQTGSDCVTRGGSAADPAVACRAARRNWGQSPVGLTGQPFPNA